MASAATDQLNPEDFQALHDTYQYLQSVGDPRAAKLGAYLSMSGMPISSAGQSPIQRSDITTNPLSLSIRKQNPSMDVTGQPVYGPDTAYGMGAGGLIEGLIANPLSAVTGLVSGAVARKGAKMLGAPEPIADAAGFAGGLAGGIGANRVGSMLQQVPDDVIGSIPFGKFAKWYTGRGVPAPPYAGQVPDSAPRTIPMPPPKAKPMPAYKPPPPEPPPSGTAAATAEPTFEDQVQQAIQKARDSAQGKSTTIEPTPRPTATDLRPPGVVVPQNTALPPELQSLYEPIAQRSGSKGVDLAWTKDQKVANYLMQNGKTTADVNAMPDSELSTYIRAADPRHSDLRVEGSAHGRKSIEVRPYLTTVMRYLGGK